MGYAQKRFAPDRTFSRSDGAVRWTLKKNIKPLQILLEML